jgi:hypothetical protein
MTQKSADRIYIAAEAWNHASPCDIYNNECRFCCQRNFITDINLSYYYDKIFPPYVAIFGPVKL